MRSAFQCAPKTCLCGGRLPAPSHGPHPDYPDAKPKYRRLELSDGPLITGQRIIHIDCHSCHTLYVWSWHEVSNGCWKIRSSLPLFDLKTIVEIA